MRQAILAFVFLLLASCAPVQIGRINADPSRYRNQTVRVSGTVVNSMGLLGNGGYQVEDKTGKIYVLSSTGVPSRGSRVTVTGTVVGGAQVFGTPVATAIREQRHKVRD